MCVCVHTVSFSVGLLEIRGECGEHFILAGLWKFQEDPCCLCGWGEMAQLYISVHNTGTSQFVIIKDRCLIIQIWTRSSSKCRQSWSHWFMSDNKQQIKHCCRCVVSWKVKPAPSTVCTCLRMPPTLSTLMTRLRQRRRTWRNPHQTCSTKLKHRSVCPIMHWCMLDLQTQGVPLLCVRYLNWWRWTATGDLCARLSTRAAPWQA